MSKQSFHRYGIVKHVKGTSYEHDCLITDIDFNVREFSHESAETFLRILQERYGNEYSFRIMRLD